MAVFPTPLADQDGIILGAPGEDLDHALDLGFAADHGVELISRASWVRSRANSSSTGLRPLLGPRVVLVAEQRQGLLADLVETGAERLEIFAAIDWPSFISPRSRCSVPM